MKITLSDLLELLGLLLIVIAVGSWNLRLGIGLVGLVVVAVGYLMPDRPAGDDETAS